MNPETIAKLLSDNIHENNGMLTEEMIDRKMHIEILEVERGEAKRVVRQQIAALLDYYVDMFAEIDADEPSKEQAIFMRQVIKNVFKTLRANDIPLKIV